MRIRSQLLVAAGLAAAVTLLALGGLLAVTQRAESGLDQQTGSQQIARDVAGMLSLTNEFAVFGGDRAVSQWRARHALLVQSVERALQRSQPAPPASLLRLQRNVMDLPPLFDKLAQTDGTDDALQRRRRDLLMERLLIETQEVVESRYAWSLELIAEQRRDHRLYTAMVLAAPAALLLLLLALGLLVARRVLRPLHRLQQAVTSIQGGDLDARCANPAADELGEAARAVDAMARALQQQSAALRASELRLRMITDNLPALVGHVDAQQRYTFANAHFLRSGAGDPAAMLGRTMREERGDAVYAQIAPYVEQALAGRSVTFETTRVIDGVTAHRQSTYVPDVDEAGSVRGFYAMTFDITARKEVELQLAASQRLLTDITDSLPALVAYIGRDQRYRFANVRHRDWLGIEPAQLIGRSVAEVCDPAVYTVIAPRLATALGGERVRFERLQQRDGRDLHYLADYIPDIAADGSVLGCYVLSIDITERREAELAVARSEQQLHELINAIPALVAYFDMQERCLYANDAGLRSHGIERSQLPGLPLRAALGDANYAQHEPFVKEALQGRRARLDGKIGFAGREAHFQAHMIPDRVEGGAQRGVHLMTFDITALKEADQRRARVERQLRAITDNVPVLIAHIDRDERYLYVNATFERWFGVAPSQTLGRTVAEVVGAARHAHRQPFLQRALAGERVEFDDQLESAAGPRRLSNTYVPDIQPDGSVAGVYLLSTDVTALKQIEDHLSQLASIDTLTGLPNRRQFEQRIVEASARAVRTGQPLALLFLDIDHFKRINDTLGHAGGDTVLKEFAARLKAAVRVTDTAARLAGDEFVVLLEAPGDAHDTALVAGKIVQAMHPVFHVEGRTLQVSTSIGAAHCRRPGPGSDLLAQADEALYEAKAAGRNTFRLREVAPACGAFTALPQDAAAAPAPATH